ncbi:MAG: neutral/alkaline non-lysosomal ceramidase N-terminal domain-containing protein [Microthrixaceae bacterium]
MASAAFETGPTPLEPFVDGSSRRSRFSVRPRPAGELPLIDGVLAGAAEVDITPPPGMPKAGYSANAHDGHGFRTRLRARVTHLRAGRASIALVQLDLLAGSSVLQYLVADAIATRTDIPLAGVWMGATHTHAGPGQFLGTDFYNQHASNRAGFDPAYTDFLVRQIAGAVIEAHDTRVPAKVAIGRTEVWGLTRNRSQDPHVQNRTVSDKRLDPQRKWVSVNPDLHLLRVDRIVGRDGDDGDGGSDGVSTEPLAAAVIFSVHGTGVPQHAHEYNADVWAYLVAELGHRIEERHGSRPVVGASEGTHADVAPALRPGLAGHREARRVGRAIGGEAAALHERLGAQLSDSIGLDAGFREVDLDRASERRVDGVELPERPAVGAALVAGATENYTPVLHRIPPFKAGHPRRWGRAGAHGPKWILGSRYLQPLVLRKRSFPRRLSVQVFRIGGSVWVGLPFEITVESGRRIAAAVNGAVGEVGASSAALDDVVVCSLVNEYWGYVATEEEYGRQFYEGGHTLYGPRTERFLSSQAARLAGRTVGRGVVQEAGERTWNLRSHRYLPRPPLDPPPERRFIDDATFLDPTDRDDAVWEQAWMDVAPGGLHWHEPLVMVERSDDGGTTWEPASRGWKRADDQGWALEVIHLGEHEGAAHHYRMRWHDPDHRAGRLHRFVLLANNGRPRVVGEPFD